MDMFRGHKTSADSCWTFPLKSGSWMTGLRRVEKKTPRGKSPWWMMATLRYESGGTLWMLRQQRHRIFYELYSDWNNLVRLTLSIFFARGCPCQRLMIYPSFKPKFLRTLSWINVRRTLEPRWWLFNAVPITYFWFGFIFCWTSRRWRRRRRCLLLQFRGLSQSRIRTPALRLYLQSTIPTIFLLRLRFLNTCTLLSFPTTICFTSWTRTQHRSFWIT